jgi:hypothetical protein
MERVGVWFWVSKRRGRGAKIVQKLWTEKRISVLGETPIKRNKRGQTFQTPFFLLNFNTWGKNWACTSPKKAKAAPYCPYGMKGQLVQEVGHVATVAGLFLAVIERDGRYQAQALVPALLPDHGGVFGRPLGVPPKTHNLSNKKAVSLVKRWRVALSP